MNQRSFVVLLVALVVLSATNSIAVYRWGSKAELYPMTAHQMFSGKPRTTVRSYVAVLVAADGTSREVPAPSLLGFGSQSSRAKSALRSIALSVEHGCAELTHERYARCSGEESLTLPQEMAEAWLQNAMGLLESEERPKSIRLIERLADLDAGPAGKPEADRDVFTWYPGSSGRTVARP